MAKQSQPPRFLAAVQDLFFVGKISAAAKRVGIPVEILPNESQILQAAKSSASVVLVDLNASGLRPLDLIRKLKENGTPSSQDQPVQVLAFFSHVQEDLKREADKAGCDLVLPRSVFFQQLDDLLRQRSCHL